MDTTNTSPLQSGNAKEAEIHGKKFWPRAGAFLVDYLAIGVLYIPTRFWSLAILGVIFSAITPLSGKSYYLVQSSSPWVGYVIGILQTVVYFGVFEWLFGRTIGKIIFRMRVIDNSGDSCNLKQAFIRSVYRLIDGLFFGIVAYSYMKPPAYQRLGDRKASTVVVSSNDAAVKKNIVWWNFILALAIYLAAESMIVMLGALLYVHPT